MANLQICGCVLPLALSEQIIYCSARIGAYKPQRNQKVIPPNVSPAPIRGRIMPILVGQLTLGYKSYELSNHLGNVLTTISDNKMMVITPPSVAGGLVYLQAVVLTTQDYYPFGKGMTERSYVNVDRNAQRYGFNGKENDEEWGGTIQDYGFRIYNPELGKFPSVDPLTHSYPFYSPYAFAGNTPIAAIDLDGAEINIATKRGDVFAFESFIQLSGGVGPMLSGSVKVAVGIAYDGYGNIALYGSQGGFLDMAGATAEGFEHASKVFGVEVEGGARSSNETLVGVSNVALGLAGNYLWGAKTVLDLDGFAASTDAALDLPGVTIGVGFTNNSDGEIIGFNLSVAVSAVPAPPLGGASHTNSKTSLLAFTLEDIKKYEDSHEKARKIATEYKNPIIQMIPYPVWDNENAQEYVLVVSEKVNPLEFGFPGEEKKSPTEVPTGIVTVPVKGTTTGSRKTTSVKTD